MEVQVAKLLTTTTMAPTALGITGQELVGDLADPTGWVPIIAGPLGGLLVAVTGKLQAHQVPGHLQALGEPSVVEYCENDWSVF